MTENSAAANAQNNGAANGAGAAGNAGQIGEEVCLADLIIAICPREICRARTEFLIVK